MLHIEKKQNLEIICKITSSTGKSLQTIKVYITTLAKDLSDIPSQIHSS